MIKNHHPGKLIVFEGIDGAGCETQVKLLFDYLKRQGKSVERLYYPDYEGPIGKLIHQYLHKQYEFSVDIQFLLYFTDFIKDREKINQWIGEGKIVICDRYFSSTLAYQGLRGFSIKKALELARRFKLPKPDLIIYLKVSPEVSMSRKYKEKKDLDRNEADKKFLKKIWDSYEKLIKGKIFSKWVVIDGEKSIEEVFSQIKKIVNEKL
ncbi:MAG: dTMP kinase [Candidatus Nealsonbacteria bacterium CG_4_10_14_0_8_um_filter_35_10]|uniref:Thymidylate kinase n=2 Tax=Candidatus Nealsoniibacteriota TaxID=1817911 RepID=A0A2M7R810_9BACT|nr:MAG: dTMP kinase [Parcubacteria group bacterium CG1_02_36_42]PIY90941.1 MAG: dTMP kinase [Candidatus Nealsonbacteria bacterium CG_4_10_14_0_8_um_filter_35_10]